MMPSRSSLVSRAMRGASASTAFGVKAWVTRDRSCRCLGGSVVIRLAANSWPEPDGLSPPRRDEKGGVLGQYPLDIVIPEHMPAPRLIVLEDGGRGAHPFVVGKGIKRIFSDVHGGLSAPLALHRPGRRRQGRAD